MMKAYYMMTTVCSRSLAQPLGSVRARSLLLQTRMSCDPQHQQYRSLSSVRVLSSSTLSLESFEEQFYRIPKAKPIVITPSPGLPRAKKRSLDLPAFDKWFNGANGPRPSPSSYLEIFSPIILPYELMVSGGEMKAIESFLQWLTHMDGPLGKPLAELLRSSVLEAPPSRTGAHDEPRLLQFRAPLALLLAGWKFNQTSGNPRIKLYIAQAQKSELPHELRGDIPTPGYVLLGGNGDVYNTNIWLGLEPTFTPWHRDPNPNFFHQLCSSKVVRLLPPDEGLELFTKTMKLLGRPVNSRIRDAGMFQGPELAACYDAVWGPEADALRPMKEAVLRPQDSLFIPQGWWHSVKSAKKESFRVGGLNASVNWWFR